jgi:hypothetical protein
MDERERRLGLNEAMFREVNERVEGMNRTFASVTGSFDIFCECSDASCTERITVPKDVYEQVRGEPTHFLIRAGHEDPTVEDVVETHGEFVVVEKQGVEVERVAEQTDPRRDDTA